MRHGPTPASFLLPLLLGGCASHTPPAAGAPDTSCPRVYLGHAGIFSPPVLTWAPGKDPVGFDPDLATLLGEGLGCELVRIEVDGMPTELRWSLLEEDRADLSIFQNSVTPQRDERVDFTHPYAADGMGVVVPVGSEAQSPSDLATARIVVAEGSMAQAWVAATLPNATLLTETNNIGDIKACFADGTCDALAGDQSALAAGAWKDERLRLLPGGPFTQDVWAVAVAEGDAELLQRLDAILAEAEADGRLPALRERYGLSAP